MRVFHNPLRLAVLLFALSPWVGAERTGTLEVASQGEVQVQVPAPVDSTKPDDAERLDRWRRMTPEEREQLKERFEALRKMSKEERATLRERSAELEHERRLLEGKLGPDQRERMRRLPPEERDRILREHQVEEHRRAGQSLRQELDPERAAWVDGLVGPGHPRPMHDARAELRGRIGGRLLERWGQAGTLEEVDRARLEGLAPPERMDELLLIHRERIERVVADEGLPEGVDEAAWTKVQAEVEPERFLKRARKLGLDLLAPPPGNPGHGWRPNWKQDKGPGEGPPSGPMTGKWGLGELLSPTLEDRLAAAALPHAERRARIEAEIAQRVRTKLADPEWMPQLDRAELTDLADSALLEALRDRAGGGRAGRGERGGPERRGPWGPDSGRKGPPPGPLGESGGRR